MFLSSKDFEQVRQSTEKIVERLEVEETQIQSMPDVSPPKWHLGHTTWFFDKFILAVLGSPSSRLEEFDYIFNSYYETVGAFNPRCKRGLLIRPTLQEVLDYRSEVNERMLSLGELDEAFRTRLTIGIHHEQQHQELLYQDILHIYFSAPLSVAYHDNPPPISHKHYGKSWLPFEGGLKEIGAEAEGFVYDNETPKHQVYLQPYAIENSLVTCGEFLEFIYDRGYQRPEFWLSDGWSKIKNEGWRAPLYWREMNGHWQQFSLAGWQDLPLNQPITHLSYYEANAFANWRNCRLPTEFEWEHAVCDIDIEGPFCEAAHLQPSPQSDPADSQYFGQTWQWTSSHYSAYPGYRSWQGELGEYNSKFMCSQFVLRGGSSFTPKNHFRKTYRNYYPPMSRWQPSGIRLARSL